MRENYKVSSSTWQVKRHAQGWLILKQNRVDYLVPIVPICGSWSWTWWKPKTICKNAKCGSIAPGWGHKLSESCAIWSIRMNTFHPSTCQVLRESTTSRKLPQGMVAKDVMWLQLRSAEFRRVQSRHFCDPRWIVEFCLKVTTTMVMVMMTIRIEHLLLLVLQESSGKKGLDCMEAGPPLQTTFTTRTSSAGTRIGTVDPTA